MGALGRAWRRCVDWLGCPDHTVADECASFLAGRYLGRMEETGGELHAWMWLNGLAHCSADELDRLANRGPRRPADFASDWSEARRTVAVRVWEVTRGDPTLLRLLQRDVLTPLELGLVNRAGVTPLGLAAAGLAALSGFPQPAG